jgi:CBS domain containing-hemolysin-like protein
MTFDDPARSAAADRAKEPDSGLFDRVLAALGIKSAPSFRDDLEDALAERGTDDEFSPRERELLKNVLGLRGRRVDDVMVPRVDIVAAPLDTSLGDLLRMFRTAGHSRLPVFGDTLDDPRGMVHIRDFLDYLAAKAETIPASRRRKLPTGAPDLGKVDLSTTLGAAKILRPVLYAPPSMPALDLLAKMQTTRTHMALVIDEYGGTDGLVSIEDLVEIVVGEIEDEHDLDDTPMIAPTEEGDFIADARAGLEEFSAVTKVDLATDDAIAEEVDTIGGYIVTLAGRVPVRGEIVAGPQDLEFEILDADPRRIKKIRVHRRNRSEPIQPVPKNSSPASEKSVGTV